MKNFGLPGLIAIILTFTSCKKNETNPASGGGGNGTASGSFTNIYGAMISEQILNYYPSIPLVDTSYSAIAWFFNGPQHNWVFTGINTTTPAGNVYLDTTRLQLFNSYPGLIFYLDSTYQLKLKNNNTWHVDGAGFIPSFSYNFTGLWPSYTGYAQLPDTVHRTQDNTIILTNITGADSVCINVNDNSGSNGHSYTSGKVVPGTSVSITLPLAKVSVLNNTANGTLTVSLFKFAPVQTVSGKNFIYVKDVEFKRTVEIDNY